MDRIKANPLPLFKRLVLPIGLVAFTAMAIEGASAHDKDCDGNPVLGRIKVDCRAAFPAPTAEPTLGALGYRRARRAVPIA
jgi:hypothetical protein